MRGVNRYETKLRPHPRWRGDEQIFRLLHQWVHKDLERPTKRGRKPLGKKAMTGAERQARFRAAHADGTPRLRYLRPSDRRGRAQRWRDAVAELLILQDDYRVWLNSLPENPEASATGDALRAICAVDLSVLKAIEPPHGFGRDRRASTARTNQPSRKPRDHIMNDERKTSSALRFELPGEPRVSGEPVRPPR